MDSDEIEVQEEMEVEEVEEEWEEVLEDDEEEHDPEEEEVIEDGEEEEEEDPEEEEEQVVEGEKEAEEPEEEQVVEDSEEEEDPEEEEQVVEEEDDPEEEEEEEDSEEEEVIGEDEDEQANDGVQESSDFQKDVDRASESHRLDRHLASSSSRTGEFKSCPELNSDDRGLKSTSPSDEQSTTLKDTCLSFDNSGKEPTLTEDKTTYVSCVNEDDSEWPTGDSQLKNRSLENKEEPRQDNIELVSLGNTGIGYTAGEKSCDSVPSTSGLGQKKANDACISGDRQSNINSKDENSGTKSRNTGINNPFGEKVSDSVPGGAAMGQKSNDACSSGNGRNDIKLEDERHRIKLRSRSFSLGGENNEPQQKRAGLVCQFFAKGWCVRGKSCRFLHVKDNLNNISQQQAGNNVVGSGEIRSSEERASDSRVSGNAGQSRQKSEASLRSREKESLANSQASQRVVFSKEDTIPSSKDTGRERLKQIVRNDGNPSMHRSSFVKEHRSLPSQPVWTGSISYNSFRMKALENGNSGSGSLSALQDFSVSHQDPEGNTARKKAKLSSDDWEPSIPFSPSFVIPPSIFPSFGALYDLFCDGMDIQNLEDEDCNGDKDSLDSQNRYREAVGEKDSEVHGGEMVATSVVEQNETTPKKRDSSEPLQNKDVVLRRSRPAGGYDSWHRSNMSSNMKISRGDRAVDDADGEVRSDSGMRAMRLFRTAVIDTVKEMLKPMWHGGRLSKAAHNTIVKKASEKVISTAVQFRQVPTDAESVERYLSVSQTKIVKLVEGYVERFRKS